MAFDRTNQADLTALKTEVDTDPIAMGYDPTGATPVLLKLLNDAANNVGGETVAPKLTTKLLLQAVEPTDLISAQVDQGELAFLESFMNRDLEMEFDEFRAKITNIFQTNQASRQNLEAQTRPLSRAEVLFGEFTTISREDWFAARDNG